MERLQRGDVIQTVTGRGVIVKIGRGVVRSAYVFWEDETHNLVTEIDWWQQQGTISFRTRRPKNLKFAKDFCRTHPNLPDL